MRLSNHLAHITSSWLERRVFNDREIALGVVQLLLAFDLFFYPHPTTPHISPGFLLLYRWLSAPVLCTLLAVTGAVRVICGRLHAAKYGIPAAALSCFIFSEIAVSMAFANPHTIGLPMMAYLSYQSWRSWVRLTVQGYTGPTL